MITEKLVLGPLHTNCYIIYDDLTKEAAVIDPASDFNIISAKISELGIKVKYIILTHAHTDHISALDELKDYTSAKICIGKDDNSALNDSNLNLCIYFETKSPVSKADISINDKDILKLGDKTITFITTPGHTIGSISVLYDNCVISGDTLFYESVGRSDFPTGSSKALIESIRTKLYTLSDDTVVYPGHGELTTIGHEKNNNMFVW